MSVSDAPWPCHLQQLIINLRGIKRKFCVYVSVIDEGDLLFGQMNKSKQARSLNKIRKNDFSYGALRFGKYSSVLNRRVGRNKRAGGKILKKH